MPPPPPRPRPIAPLAASLVAALSLMSGAALAQTGEDVSVVVTLADEPTDFTRSVGFALRMDNYIDVVDSVLNARVRTRREAVFDPRPARRSALSEGHADGGALGAPDGLREDTLYVRRVAQPPRLPPGPLVVRTTAAFTGKGAPAGAATWPPTSGRLSIGAADGSRIELDADTGDIASVNVTLTSGTRVYVFREAWATWAPLVLNDR